MKVRVGDRLFRGEAIDLPPAVRPAAVYDAVVGGPATADGGLDRRADDDPGQGKEQAGLSEIVVDAPDPGLVHEHVGLVESGVSLSLRGALAAAARSRGYEAPEDDAIADVEAALDDLDPPTVSTEAERRRASEAGDRTAELDERVAELRGRIRTLRALDRDASEAQAELREAIAALTEARTERIAAEQALERERERARAARDARERRLRLEDRLGNLRRAAREHLAGLLHDEFADAVAVVPGPGVAGDGPGAFVGDPATAALAVVRVADLDAPVVLACGRFRHAAAAADRLDSRLIRIPPGS